MFKHGLHCTAIAMAILATSPAVGADKMGHGMIHKHVGGLSIVAAWARASAGPAKAGAAFVTIKNTGAMADRLVGVAAPVARRVEIHTHTMKNNLMRMRRVDALTVAAKATTALKPGGQHVMLIGLHQRLKQGDHFPLTLTFEKAGTMTVTVKVGGVAARGPAMMKHGHHK